MEPRFHLFQRRSPRQADGCPGYLAVGSYHNDSSHSCLNRVKNTSLLTEETARANEYRLRHCVMGCLLTSLEPIAAPPDLRLTLSSVSGVANTGFNHKRGLVKQNWKEESITWVSQKAEEGPSPALRRK